MPNRLLDALCFAAAKHADQRRKNAAATPYINHPIEVAQHLSQVGDITDEDILIAALLHDTIEDTDTTADEISERFGERVAGIVLECSDDKDLPKAERKRLQIVNASRKSPEAKLVKIADKTCNIRALVDDPPVDWSTERQRQYWLWGSQVLEGLYGDNAALDAAAQEVLESCTKRPPR